MSIFGNILKVLGVVGAPFTGGLSAIPAIASVAGDVINAKSPKGSGVAGAAGQAIGAATTASGNNRLTQEQLALRANEQNNAAMSDYERNLMQRALLEDRQRGQAAKDSYRNSVAHNLSSSPFNPRPQVLSDQFKTDMGNLGTTASRRLAATPQYDAASLPDLALP